ncbi:hypothetical protein QUF72_09850 [Desulfobacterales bacterium HSG2]|nr:hypothetical protein [Desulfobacterales bacterium HSG2]
MRLIQLYGSSGGYHADNNGEDGFVLDKQLLTFIDYNTFQGGIPCQNGD